MRTTVSALALATNAGNASRKDIIVRRRTLRVFGDIMEINLS
ncbi:hypothetical protein Mpsy_1510 [Methanolobus psychrophilus R15]|nr:hypothetical protein Mpsy_1510 [Methanolobus psychrophilus R15]